MALKAQPSGTILPQTSQANHGVLKMSEPGGGTMTDGGGKIFIPYGRDTSFANGQASDERGQTGFKGGDRDLSSSITSGMAANGRKG